MNEYYEMGAIAAVTELEKCAAEGDKLAASIYANLPQEVKDIDVNVKVASYELAEELAEKEASAKVDAIKKGVGAAWKGISGKANKAKDAYAKSIKSRANLAKTHLSGAKAKNAIGDKVPLKARLKAMGRAGKKVAPELGAVGGLGAGAYLASR